MPLVVNTNLAVKQGGGLPFMASAFAALTSGHDMAEAFYSAIPLNTRWNTVVFGDPLYAPFRPCARRPDETPPAIERLTLHALRSPGGGDDKVSQRRRYFYTRRFAYELADLLPDREYPVRVSARDPFGNVGSVTGTVKTLR